MMTNDEILAAPGRAGKLGAELCDTPTSDALGHVFRLCQAEGELGIVTGEPGVGKTSAARRYAASMEAVHLITISPATSGLVPCLERIGAAVGAYPSNSGSSAWTEAIRFRLAQEPDAPLLLIDEAHHLSDASVEEIRAIFDAAPALGVVFIGSRELRERWSGRRWAQLTSRVFQRIDLDGPMPADIDAICAAAGIEGKRSRDLMRRDAAKPGGLRVVRKLLGVAEKLAGPGQPLKAEHVELAFRDRAEVAA